MGKIGYFVKTLAILARIENRLRDIEGRLSRLTPSELSFRASLVPNDDLLSIPDHLRKSLIALRSTPTGISAADTSAITGRCRALESHYLNQLCLSGYADKVRSGKCIVFFPRAKK